MSIRKASVITACLSALVTASAANAAVISYSSQNTGANGTGFGNILSLLVVQKNASEAGSVLWTGSGDATTGDAKPQAQTQSAGTLAAAGVGGTTFALIFNVNENGNPKGLVLNSFELVFQNAAGAELFTAAYTAPVGGLPLAQVGGGQGASGHLFNVTLTPAESTAFFASPGNRIGQRLLSPITGTGGGAEGFYVQAVPEPLTLSTAALAAAGLTFARRRRRAK